jgi:hypothetical protein
LGRVLRLELVFAKSFGSLKSVILASQLVFISVLLLHSEAQESFFVSIVYLVDNFALSESVGKLAIPETFSRIAFK